jgi:glycosyltransferase involved in cell wall biosynthesis
MPKVSVIIPTYNRARLLERAIRSVLNQTYQDFEIIVVDDVSTDSTKEVVESFNDERIRYIQHEKNRGEAAARNTGIKSASGKYIASHDSDDEWLPEKLGRQVRILENSPREVGVIYTGFWRIKGNGKIYIPPSEVTKREGDIHKELLKGNFVGTPTTLIKRECFKTVGMFDERLFHLVDWEMWIRISKCYEFKYVDEPLVNVFYTLDSVSTKQDAFIEALELILEKHYKEFAKSKRLLAKHQYWTGSLLCKSGKVVQGRGYVLKAVKSYPLNIKYLVAAFVSLFGQGAYAKVVKLKRSIRPVEGSYREDLW